MSRVKFTATKLNGKNKQGILKPDSDGYYELVVGGLNVLNSMGEYYALEGARELFSSSSVLMRRVANGQLRGELGHPARAPGMSDNTFINRLFTIDERNVVCHFKELWLDESYGRNNPALGNRDLVAIMAKVKPSGPKGKVLADSLNNPSENVAFSIRALTNDHFHRGRNIRVLDSIQCWDMVNEPGIAISNKWDSPSLESLTELVVTEEQLEQALELPGSVATESTKILIRQALTTFNTQHHYKDW